jgi:AcrR family transcriptional regulator
MERLVDKSVSASGFPGMTVTDDQSGTDLVPGRKAAILDAAEGLLAVHGFDALRLRDVSKAAGVSIGTIQHYFTTRDELVYETMRVASERRAEQWADLSSGHSTAPAKVSALLEGAISDRHRCIIWLETCAAATRHADLLPNVQRTLESWRRALSDAIEQGIATGEFTEVIPANQVADVLVSLIDGLMVAAAVDTASETRQEYRVQLLRDAAQRLLEPV